MDEIKQYKTAGGFRSALEARLQARAQEEKTDQALPLTIELARLDFAKKNSALSARRQRPAHSVFFRLEQQVADLRQGHESPTLFVWRTRTCPPVDRSM